jgi:hypothetical protein
MKAKAEQSTNARRCQYDHLALRMTPSEQLKLEGRERAPTQNNNKTKPKQLNLRKAYPLIWS